MSRRLGLGFSGSGIQAVEKKPSRSTDLRELSRRLIYSMNVQRRLWAFS